MIYNYDIYKSCDNDKSYICNYKNNNYECNDFKYYKKKREDRAWTWTNTSEELESESSVIPIKPITTPEIKPETKPIEEKPVEKSKDDRFTMLEFEESNANKE